MQLSNIPGKLVLPFANAGGKSTIPVASQIGITAGAASFVDGFPPLTRTPIAAGGVPPSGLDMNGVLYELSAVIRWANAGGGYPFDNTFATDTNVGGYPKGARIMRADGAGYWYNTTDNNVTDPESAGAAAAGWVPDFTTGVAAVTMTSANVTLTPTQYGKPVIVITGTLTANLNLIFPAIVESWNVINNTTGNFIITAKTQAGVGVAVKQAACTGIVGNGVDIFSIIDTAGFAVRFATIADMLAITQTEKTFVLVEEYAAGYGPEGGGLFKWSPTSSAAHDGFVTFIPASSPATGRWVRTGYTELNVKQAGCKWDGVADDTARAQFAINYGIANGVQINLPPGNGAVTELTVQDAVYNFVLHNQGAYLIGTSSVAKKAILNLVNCVDFDMTGVWRFSGNDNTNYRAGLAIRAQAGTSQATTRVNIYNPTFRNCGIGISNGEYNVDYQCSEINVFGANFFQTPCPLYNGGSNTGIQFHGSNLTSEHNAAFVGVPETGIWQEGGFIKLSGGSMVTNPTATFAVTANPCQSAMYSSNLYGTIDVVGSHVEVNSPLLGVSNPRALSAPVSDASSYKFVGCTGYAGGDPAQDFIFVADATYAGLVETKSNNWYSSAVRTAYNMSATSLLARFSTDKTSFGKNFKNWLGGIYAGHVIHDMEPIISASGLGATYTAGTTNVLKFLTKNVANELAHYQEWYNPSTGTFEVPPGGFARLQIQCYIAGTSATSADFYLKRGGAIVAFGTFTGIGNLNATLFDLVAGEVLEIGLTPYGANYTSDTGIYNSLQITGETR